MISKEVLQRSIDIYFNSTGVNAFAIDSNGNIVCEVSNPHVDCKMFMGILRDGSTCKQTLVDSGHKSVEFGGAYIFNCKCGFVHWAAPIVVNKVLTNILIAGPVLLESPDEYLREEIAKKNNLTPDQVDRVMSVVEKLPVVTPERARYLSELLLIMAGHISTEELGLLKDKKQFYETQAKIAEELQEIKENEDEQISSYYPLEKERKLVKLVKAGDSIGAKTILNELLGQVLFKSGGNFEYMKARVLELVVVLSRAAVEGGADLEMILGLNYRYIRDMGSITNVDELCYWLIKVLNGFMQSVYNVANTTTNGLIREAIDYMKKNYNKDISLEDVSQRVFLSPNYFSRLFKEETNMGFTDYLNKLRVEESKKYLARIDLSILDVALSVGFQDQSYYTRVFKKYEGISPGQFRKINWGLIQ